MTIPPEPSPAPATRSAFAILREDMQRVDRLLRGYASLASLTTSSFADRNGLVERMGAYLHSAARIEEEIIYPQLDGVVDAEALAAARSNHEHIVRQLRAVAESASRDGPQMDQRVHELAVTARAHVALEEERLFAPGAPVDTPELAARVALRRAQLLGEQGPD